MLVEKSGCVCCQCAAGQGWLSAQLVAVIGLDHCGHTGEKGRSPQLVCLTVAMVGLLVGGASSWHSWLTGPSNNWCGHAGGGEGR